MSKFIYKNLLHAHGHLSKKKKTGSSNKMKKTLCYQISSISNTVPRVSSSRGVRPEDER